jgi:hypothetical protein
VNVNIPSTSRPLVFRKGHNGVTQLEVVGSLSKFVITTVGRKFVGSSPRGSEGRRELTVPTIMYRRKCWDS